MAITRNEVYCVNLVPGEDRERTGQQPALLVSTVGGSQLTLAAYPSRVNCVAWEVQAVWRRVLPCGELLRRTSKTDLAVIQLTLLLLLLPSEWKLHMFIAYPSPSSACS